MFSYSALKRLQLDALVVFVQGGELSLLGGEDEVSGMLFVNKLTGVQVIAEVGRLMCLISLAALSSSHHFRVLNS